MKVPIFEKNVMRFGTRDEAIQAGTKLCAECRPRSFKLAVHESSMDCVGRESEQ